MEKQPAVYWFDMDDTLIANDCDMSWKEFLIAEGLADAEETHRLANRYFEEYKAGTMDNAEFVLFQHREYAGRTPEEMAALAQKHFEKYVKNKIYPEALAMVREVLHAGKPCAIITSTASAVARPIAACFGIPEVIGTELEVVSGRYTGRLAGTYPVGPGKVEYLHRYCAEHNLAPADFAYFGDSINDRFLLGKVGFPTACNPGPALRKLAQQKGWPIRDFTAPGGKE